MLYLNDTFAALWAGADAFECAMALEGEAFRDQPSRRTIRFRVEDRRYFAKIHSGVGWREIFKNLLQFKWPTLSARNEWEAIRRLGELGLDTMTICAFGEQGRNPARIRSFIVTEALEDVESLEFLFRDPAHWHLTARQRFGLVEHIARITRELHAHGVNHRDYYLCHLLLARETLDAPHPRIHVIDLHRAQLREQTPVRWRVKDLSALFYSAVGEGLRRRDVLRFVSHYSGRSVRDTLADDAAFWRRVHRRAIAMVRADRKAVPAWLERLGRGRF